MTATYQTFRGGEVIEFTLRGERRTAEVMLATRTGTVLLDLFDGERMAWAQLALLEDLAVFHPDPGDALPERVAA
ncbi:MAG TPA: hypothetical protein VFV65_06535 [Gemmatimonadales bacterium]|nr:hypothetical protein [Gemmatimonadales bacterium]